MLIDFGRASLVEKVRKHPNKVTEVIHKIRTDGFISTLDAINTKLDQPLPLGYCNSGVVLSTDSAGFAVGDRVVSNGTHSEIVAIQNTLCAKIPDTVDDESSAFTVLGAVALQGVRLANPTLGEVVVVKGLGLIGLMAIQILRANGCRVLGVDIDPVRCVLAEKFGVPIAYLGDKQALIKIADEFSRGRGVDAVIICANSESNDLIRQSAEICRKRGRIILVGTAGLKLRRDDFYKKEISFQVSSSYGPGRYDPTYEEKGYDYPIGFIRWTAQRNFEAVLDMMASGLLQVKPLITHRVSINNATEAYSALNDPSALGILIEYKSVMERTASGGGKWAGRTVDLNVSCEQRDLVRRASQHLFRKNAAHVQPAIVACIGAGNYASRVLIPALKHVGAELDTLASIRGLNCVHHGTKNGFSRATTDLDSIWMNSRINTVVIATRHNAHATQVLAALKSGKNVFVEKPLCISLEELDQIRDATQKLLYSSSSQILTVGFNRRFSPHIKKIKQLLTPLTTPKSFVLTVNAGEIQSDHWTQDREIGAGRIIGEACHFIDLLRFLAGSQITQFERKSMVSPNSDTLSIVLSFADGSIGTVHYFSNGNKSFPKERLEVFAAGRVFVLDNYRKLTGYGWPNFSSMRLWKQDKGQLSCVKAFMDAIADPERDANRPPIPLEELFEVAEVTIKLAT
jgi:predicted dehydrogenase